MSLLKVSDNYSAYIVGNFNSTAETITVDVAPVKTAGYLTIFDLNGNQFEKIKYTGVDGLNLTGCIRGLSFNDNSDTPVEGNAQDLKNGMAIKMTVTQHYINPLVDVVNGTNAFEGVPKNPSTRTISDNRHLTDKEYVDGISAGGILSMLVSIDSGLNININSGNYILNGTVETYAGVASEPLTDDETNYIQLVDGVLTINTTGFVDDAIPLATAICADGEITSLVDSRPFYTGVDLKDDSGLGRDSDGLFIDLGTDSGLEFSEDGLEVKTKTDGGLTKDSDGLSVDTGVTEGKIVQLIAGDKLPAVDGSNLTGILAKNLILSASDDLKVSSDVETVAASEGTYTKYKEIQLKLTKGVVRVSFDLKQSSAPQTVYGRIYINGVAAGTERSVTGTTDYVTFSEDLTVAKDDKIQLYMKDNGGTVTYQARNFRISYDIELDTDFEVLMQDFAY